MKMFRKIREWLFGLPPPKPVIKIEMWKDLGRKWRFRLIAANSKILCDSEAYQRKQNCRETAELIKNSSFAVTEK